MKKIRLYLDTSVIGGYFDEEFSSATRRLFVLLEAGIYQACLSELTLLELSKAPTALMEKVNSLLARLEFDELKESAESFHLARAYLENGVLPMKCLD
ncbi:MAG TPA: PIN domain protein, partial [bacterium]|nr:PIN domain protein [bacterium]